MRDIRIGICALLAFEVAAFGGVQPWGMGILEIGAAVLFLAWGIQSARRGELAVRWNWLYLPMLGLAGTAMAQVMLSISAYPYATKIELLKWAAYLMLGFLATESFRTTEERNRFTWFLVCLAFVFAVYGIAQTFTFNGKLYWSIPLPDGAEPFGPFVNRDHFAGFIELTAPLGLALLFGSAYRKEKAALLYIFTLLPIGAIVLSASRGGMAGFLLALVIVVVFSRPQRMENKKLAAMAALGVAAVGFVLWLGAGQAITRLTETSANELTTGTRMAMARDTWHIFVDHRWAGTGLGTLETVYPKYASFYDRKTVDHAHDDYMELLAETGILGGVCGLGFTVALFWSGLKNMGAAAEGFDRAFYVGAIAACSAILLHSAVDFNLHIPANALLFVLLTTLATAPNQS